MKPECDPIWGEQSPVLKLKGTATNDNLNQCFTYIYVRIYVRTQQKRIHVCIYSNRNLVKQHVPIRSIIFFSGYTMDRCRDLFGPWWQHSGTVVELVATLCFMILGMIPPSTKTSKDLMVQWLILGKLSYMALGYLDFLWISDCCFGIAPIKPSILWQQKSPKYHQQWFSSAMIFHDLAMIII